MSGGPPEEDRPIHWGRYVSALWRGRWLLLLIVIGGTGAGIMAARRMRPTYEVQARLWVNSTSQVEQARGPIRAGELLQTSGWTELLSSFAIVDSVVHDLRLYVTPEVPADSVLFRQFGYASGLRTGRYALQVEGNGGQWALLDEDDEPLERGAAGDSIGRGLGFRWAPARAELGGDRLARFSTVHPRDAAVRLLQDVSVSLPRESNFLRITLTSADPTRSAEVLNNWIGHFVATAAELKRRNLVEFERILFDQLEFAERELRNAEMGLENFRATTITLPSEGGPVAAGVEVTRDPVLSSFFTRKTEYDDVRNDREALERALIDARGGRMSVGALVAMPALGDVPPLHVAVAELNAKQAQLRAMQSIFTDEHPSVRATLASIHELETRTIPQIADSRLAVLRMREVDLGRRIAGAARELRQIPPRTIEEMRLNRQVLVSENLYNTLKARFEEAKLARASATPDLSVLDAAVAPQRPSRDPAPKFVVAAFLASLAVGVALMLLRDVLDRRLRYADQVTEGLGLPIIGAIPRLPRQRAGKALDVESVSQVFEAFRALRLSVRFGYGAQPPIALVVSSPSEGDGKSFTSSNLALSFAEAGSRTLLIDGDARRGTLHAVFAVERRPGLIDYLAGDFSKQDIIRPTSQPMLDLIPSGSRRQRAPELLSSERTHELLASLRETYDVVIIDTPPLSAGVDAYALAAAAGHLLLVLRNDQTDRRLAAAKLTIVDRLPVEVVGAVLNDILSAGEFRYYAYSAAYTSGTELEDEPDQLLSDGRHLSKR